VARSMTWSTARTARPRRLAAMSFPTAGASPALASAWARPVALGVLWTPSWAKQGGPIELRSSLVGDSLSGADLSDELVAACHSVRSLSTDEEVLQFFESELAVLPPAEWRSGSVPIRLPRNEPELMPALRYS